MLIKVGGDAHWGGALISLAGALEHRNGDRNWAAASIYPILFADGGFSVTSVALSYNKPFLP